MFISKLFTYCTYAYLKKKVFQCEIFDIFFPCKDKDFQICICVTLSSFRTRCLLAPTENFILKQCDLYW